MRRGWKRRGRAIPGVIEGDLGDGQPHRAGVAVFPFRGGTSLPPPGPERVLASLIIDHVLLAMPPGKQTAARAFFVGVLGMVEGEKPPRLQSRGGCWFRRGSCKVHVGVDEDFQPQRKAHPAFGVDEIDGLSDRLTEAGHDVVWDGAIPGLRRFFTADPFGNRIEFLQNSITTDTTNTSTERT